MYKYSKFQIPGATSSTDPNPLTSSRTRYFNLSSNSLLFNATLLGKGYSEKLAYDLDKMGLIQPFVGAGIGISYNNMSNFHTILSGTNYSTSVMDDYLQPALAYQLNAGLEWKYERIAIDVGYRYFYAGGFSSSNYLTTNLSTSGTPVATTGISPWTGILSANEVFVTAKIQF